MNALTQVIAAFAALVTGAIAAVCMWYLWIAISWLLAILLTLAAAAGAAVLARGYVLNADTSALSAKASGLFASVKARFASKA